MKHLYVLLSLALSACATIDVASVSTGISATTTRVVATAYAPSTGDQTGSSSLPIETRTPDLPAPRAKAKVSTKPAVATPPEYESKHTPTLTVKEVEVVRVTDKDGGVTTTETTRMVSWWDEASTLGTVWVSIVGGALAVASTLIRMRYGTIPPQGQA